MASLKSVVNGDIALCDEIIEANNEVEAEKQIPIFSASYGSYIHDFHNGLEYYQGVADYINDIRIIKKKLELFRGNGCQPVRKYEREKFEINNHNNNNNTNSNRNSIIINIDFDTVKKEIENTGFLPQEQIEEIINKINELEEIHDSDENRNKKWSALKGSLEWLSTKGVDVATKILPLIMKTVE